MKNLLSFALFTLIAALLVQSTAWAITPIPALLLSLALTAFTLYELERKFSFLAPSPPESKKQRHLGRVGNILVAALVIAIPWAVAIVLAYSLPTIWAPAIATVGYVLTLCAFAEGIKVALP